MKVLSVLLLALSAAPCFAYFEPRLEIFGQFAYTGERMVTVQKPITSTSFTFGFGGGITLGAYFGSNSSFAQGSFTLNVQGYTGIFDNKFAFGVFDFFGVFSLSFPTSVGFFSVELFGAGVALAPVFNAQYEKIGDTYPYTYEKGSLGTPLNLGLLIALPGFHYRGWHNAGFTVGFRLFLNIQFRDGAEEAARRVQASFHDNIRWKTVIRLSLFLGFDFFSLAPEKRIPRVY